ncbi:hypothetical protein AAMO2058_000640000 [Amorphochlora amoebiformis]
MCESDRNRRLGESPLVIQGDDQMLQVRELGWQLRERAVQLKTELEAYLIKLGVTSAMIIAGIVTTIAVAGVLLVTSFSMYVSFYNFYVPAAMHEFTVHFDSAQGLTQSSFPTQPKPPIAVVNLLKQHQWDSHEGRLNLTAMLVNEEPFLLVSDVEYDAVLTLVLSPSKNNAEIGSFMVKFDVLADSQQTHDFVDHGEACVDEEGDTCVGLKAPVPPPPVESSDEYRYQDISAKNFDVLASSRRMVSVPGQSMVVSMIWSFVFAIPILLGFTDESTCVTVPLMERYREHPYIRAARLRLILSEKIDVLRASIRLKTKMEGLRYYMFHWFLLTGTASVAAIFVVQFTSALSLAILLWFQFRRPQVIYERDSSDSETDHEARFDEKHREMEENLEEKGKEGKEGKEDKEGKEGEEIKVKPSEEKEAVETPATPSSDTPSSVTPSP